MNREGIRRLAAEELGLATSPYRFASSLDELQAACAEIGFPCVVKPVMSSSGKGQSKLDSAADVEHAWNYAAAGGRVDAGRVIVEGFIDFDYEITLLTVRAIGADGAVETQFCEPIGHMQVHGDYVESWQPQPMSAAARWSARARSPHKVTANLGGQGVFGVELFVKGDMVWFSEVSPRPHDTGMVTMATQVQSEFELHAKAILGLPVNVGAARAGRVRRDLRPAGRSRHRLRRRGRRAARAGQRHPPVRQAGIVRAPPHGRGAGDRRRCRHGACARAGGGRQGQAGVGGTRRWQLRV